MLNVFQKEWWLFHLKENLFFCLSYILHFAKFTICHVSINFTTDFTVCFLYLHYIIDNQDVSCCVVCLLLFLRLHFVSLELGPD